LYVSAVISNRRALDSSVAFVRVGGVLFGGRGHLERDAC